MYNELKENEIFVFGSNLNGNHSGGAAKQAHEQFGAEWGVGEGITGQCYAFPTLKKDMDQRHHLDLEGSVRKLFNCAIKNHDKTFLLTKVGCGIAGYSEAYMISLFRDMPKNVIKPENW